MGKIVFLYFYNFSITFGGSLVNTIIKKIAEIYNGGFFGK